MLREKGCRSLVPLHHEIPLLGHKSFDPLLVLQHGSPDILQEMGRPGKYTISTPMSKVLKEVCPLQLTQC